jgi:hypothetical protein
VSTSGDREREEMVLVNQRLLDLYDHGVAKTTRWVRVCGVALAASALILWKAVPSLPAEAGRRVFTLCVAVGGFAAASLVVLGVLLAIWVTKKRSVVATLLELRRHEAPR